MSGGGYEYTADAYGSGGWQSGGGFLAGRDGAGTQMGGFGAGSPSGGASKMSNRDKQTLLPVTIRQLLSVSQSEPDDHFRIDGVELHQVKLIGQIVEVEETSTTRTYKIDDGTGVFAVRMFIETDENEYQQERRSECRKDAYVRVVGQLRDWQGAKSISCHDMRPIKDPNEITHHLLEAIFSHCFHTKGRPQQTRKAGAPAGMAMGNAMGGNMSGSYGSGVAYGGQVATDGNFDIVQSKVLAAFQQDTSDAGRDEREVIEQLGREGISVQAVKNAINFLSNEGHLYTTTDDTHYKATD